MKLRTLMYCLYLFAMPVAYAAQPIAATSRLGLLVDSSSAQRAQSGLPVLGATPGSIADHLGLRPGDVVVDVNGTALGNLGVDADGRALAASTFNASVAALPPSAPLRLRVLRSGVTLALNAPLHGVDASGDADLTHAEGTTAQGCGRISTFDVAPRSAHQYHATIILLDGVTPGPSGQQTYRVRAGTHELLVAEDIPTEQMGVGSIAALRARRDNSKKLTVTVKPNTTAMIAAQLHVDKASHFANAGYWDPVLWREVPQACP
jgi:hypothetical protein